jgi:asparagine synthase (glutamine-hydrolysing)
MCGIAGIVSLGDRPVATEEVQSMCAAIVHRGPDDEGFFVAPGVGLGMRRLSIIDLATGHQPVGNEDGSIQVVLNGEIYNFQELRCDLERRGHSFYTATDTETIVHLYEDRGARCVEAMRGMFAFALWDGRNRTLLLARDRLGVKPLYYAEAGGRLLFASELKAILQLPEIERKLDPKSVNYLFTFQSTSRSDSIIEGVKKLPPGHILIAAAGKKPVIERYWDVRFEPDYGKSEDYFVERLRELLDESVRLRLVSDVPLGAFLSGGVDSSSVVAAMARLGADPLKTFSIGFKEAAYNELPHARSVAQRFGAEHHELVLEPDALKIIDDLAWFLDEPFGDPSCIPTYMVSKLAAGHVKVALSGDGGDELFGGYDKYVVEGDDRRYKIPRLLRNALGAAARLMPDGMRGRNMLYHFSLEGAERYLDSIVLFTDEQKRKLFRADEIAASDPYEPWRRELRAIAEADGNWLSALQYMDLMGYLPNDILTKVDRMSMAHSLEARDPLLDHKLVEFAATIPPELQLRGGVTKYIFKRALRGVLPDEIIDRRKQGFAVPLEHWFRGELDGFVRDLLFSSRSRQRGIFNFAFIDSFLKQHERRRSANLHVWTNVHVWTLISFELWCRTFLDRRPAASQISNFRSPIKKQTCMVGELSSQGS